MDTPVIMSALVRGMLFTAISAWRLRRFMAAKPMEAAVPATMAISDASTLTSSVVWRALRMALS